MSASGYIHIEVELVKRVTEAAILVIFDGEEMWLPKSQVADPDDYSEGDENATISITEWIAKQKGFEL